MPPRSIELLTVTRSLSCIRTRIDVSTPHPVVPQGMYLNREKIGAA